MRIVKRLGENTELSTIDRDSTRGFGSVASASRFCHAFDEVRQFFRVRTTKQQVSLAHQREVFRHQLDALKAMMLVA
jgi:putative transposase